MARIRHHSLRTVGIIGTIFCLALFISHPSFPTPDKLVVFLTFIFLSISQAKEMLKRLLPFAVGIIIYESFRSIADILNTHVNYKLPIYADQTLFGTLPTVTLQNWLWHGHIQWYDFLFYIPYLLFFVLTFGLAILVWKTRDNQYWKVINTFTVLFFLAFLTFLLMPSAPPWLASENHYIQPITRISSYVWASVGLTDFPSVYNQLAPNPVAAIPSLHTACSALFSIFIFRLYGKKWGYLSIIYPVLVIFGIIYQGEHYVFDVIAGIAYAYFALIATPTISRWIGARAVKIKNSNKTKSVLKLTRL